VKTLEKADAEAQNANYLMNEIRERLPQQAAKFRLSVQLAEDGDEVNDATVVWPDDRQVVELGTIVIEAAMADAAAYEKATMFNPLALPEGIEPSADPILLARPGAYAVSFQHRMD
ncbi:MAG TPA: catalase, partial [Methylophaga sp.]|nr:catalase [Methylophaga sp.]